MNILKQSVELVTITTGADTLIEACGRVCYRSEGRIGRDFIRSRLIAQGHESVLEHAVATFLIICDRGITHELVRHRIASYSQESTRFCDYQKERFGGEISIVQPPGLSERQLAAWHGAMVVACAAYKDLRDLGQPPEIARSVLPTCLASRIAVTMNFREWRHFLALRTSPKAHPQMREVAKAIGRTLARQSCCFEEWADPPGNGILEKPEEGVNQ
jgi:thymidylate synthase (FAD)